MAVATQPLGPEDLAILELECSTVVGHTCKVILLDTPGLTRDALLDRLGTRLERTPLLRCRLNDPVKARDWVPDPEFDVRNHIVSDPGRPPVDRQGLLQALSELFEQHLDRSRPLWCIDMFELQGGGTALVWRLHHAMADGTTAIRLANLLLWDESSSEDPEPHVLAKHAGGDDARRRAGLAGFLRREFSRQRGPSPFDGTIGTSREVGLATTSLNDLKRAAHSLDAATVNDAALAVVAGALRRWLELGHGPLSDVRVRVPVSLHHEHDEALNRDSYFSLELPLRKSDPRERLREIHQATSERKKDADAQHLEHLYDELAAVSPRLRHLAVEMEDSPRRFALSVSNVPGPPHPVSILDVPVSELFCVVEIGERHALRISIVSHAGKLCFGLCADPLLVPDLHVMASAIEDEADALVTEISGR